MLTINLKIKTINKLGVSYEVLGVFKAHEVDIVLLEVSSNVIYVKGCVKNNVQLQSLKEDLEAMKLVKGLSFLQHFPSEDRYKQLSEFFSRIEEPLVLSDANFTILQENAAFKKIHKNKKLTKLRDLIQNKEVFSLIQSKKKIEGFELELNNAQVFIANVSEYTSAHSGGKSYIWNFHSQELIQRKLNRPQQQFLNALSDIIHQSEQIRILIEMAEKIAQSDSTVLIRGESGTGKELFARGIHKASKRSQEALITVNCAAIPDSLLESELFGHEAGSFTGSRNSGKIGLFEQAHKGTLFLDEIGDLPHHLQSKLLRVIEDKLIRRVGGERTIPVDVRIIAATNQALEELIEKGSFRLDLFYRLNVYNIHIPPLRLRQDDIPLLAIHFLDKMTRQLGKEKMSFSDSALEKLEQHDWKGNVRELENLVERLALLARNNKIEDRDINLYEGKTKREERKPYDYRSIRSYKAYMQEFEEKLFMALAKQGKSTRELAKELQLSHTSVANKLRKYRS